MKRDWPPREPRDAWRRPDGSSPTLRKDRRASGRSSGAAGQASVAGWHPPKHEKARPRSCRQHGTVWLPLYREPFGYLSSEKKRPACVDKADHRRKSETAATVSVGFSSITQWPALWMTTPWTLVAAALATTAIIGPNDF